MLSVQDFEDAAIRLGCKVAAIRAVALVESSGSGFWAVGKPKVLFERHRMYKLLARKYGHARANELALKHINLVNPNRGGYSGSTELEQGRVERAREIDNQLGLQAASWGMFQILGEHYQTCGFTNAVAFVLAMSKSEASQLDVFVRFVQADPVLLAALRELNWAKFAARYNGPKYRENKYDVKMAEAYSKFLRG